MATNEIEPKLRGLTKDTEHNAASLLPTPSSMVSENCQAKLTNEEMKTNQCPKIVSDTFPFLRLPAEIRNEIYRLVLLTRNIMTDKLKIEHSDRDSASDEEVDEVGSVQLSEEAVGTVRCECWPTYTLRHQVSMLVVNRQIYHEAYGIFCLENFWTIVQINKKGFAKEMKDRGFPIISLTAGEPWCYIRSPVLKVEVTFSTLERQNQSDRLVVATDHLQHLMRALWTAKGVSEMGVSIDVQSPLRENSPSENALLEPFISLRDQILP
ncbi:hypothetical protein MMC07_001090 [Pseudocyphellaria aurata]|nr:hypothetical protein [Pseudocyphellaria aurata]